jgi:hypothetical protein
VKVDNHAQFRRAEKVDEGMALKIRLERKHPPMLSYLIIEMEMFDEKSCLPPFKWIKMPLLERQSQDKSLPMIQNKGEGND